MRDYDNINSIIILKQFIIILLGSNETCYINENIQNVNNGHDLNGSKFLETKCSSWCPSQICSICANFTSFSPTEDQPPISLYDVISCGHDNKATQMGMESACTKFDPELNSKNSKTGVSCFCKETRCYCYCVLKDCVCNNGISLKSFRLNLFLFLTIIKITVARML